MPKKTVFKYVLNLSKLTAGDRLDLEVPRGAKPLHVAAQHGELCLWAQVPVTALPSRHTLALAIHGTGHPFEHSGKYLGTGLLQGGQLVLHVFHLTA